MAKVVLIFNDNVLGQYPLTNEYTTIGRTSDNDIYIDNLAVSGHHARILTILNDSFLEDLGSTNGTYVNGKLIKKHPLVDGETISIGKHLLRYTVDDVETGQEDGDEESEFEKTMIISPSAMGLPANESATSLPADAQDKIKKELQTSKKTTAVHRNAMLKIVTGTNAGKELKLTKALTTVGKAGVQAAAISKRPSGFFLVHIDGGKQNLRPKLNNLEMGTRAEKLEHGDTIEVAGIKLQFIMQ